MNENKSKPKSKCGPEKSMFEIMQYQQYLDEDTIIEAIQKHPTITKYCYILHDKDLKDDGTPKPPHWHIFIKLTSSHCAGAVAEWFGIEMQYVNTIKSGRYDTGALYCVHAHAKEKYQYNPSDVSANFDYQYLVQKDAEKNDNSERKREILSKIDNGEIREYNIHFYVNMYEYVKYKIDIEKAFEYRRKKISKEHKEKDVIYIQGASGVGKTSYAVRLAKDKGLSYVIAGADNDPLESYMGEDVLILDELRGSDFRLGNLLKMLDNHANSLAKSRYHNKVLECSMIIITTSEDIDTFFCHVFAEHPESKVQLERRCQTYIVMDYEQITVKLYNEIEHTYKDVGCFENPTREQYPVKEFTEEYINERLDYLFPNYTKKEASTPNKGTPDNASPIDDNIIQQLGFKYNKEKDEYFI